MRTQILTAVLALAVAPLVRADPPARLDRFGDPLPAGALLRLGTIGFRVPNLAGVGFRPGGELVALTADLELYIFPADGSPKPRIVSLTGKRQRGWRRAISADARFAAAYTDKKVVVWDISGKEPAEYLTRDVANEIYKIGFSANGTWLAVNDASPQNQGTVALCNLTTKRWDDLPFTGRVDSLSFTLDGKSLAIVDAQGVYVFDSATSQERLRVQIPNIRPQSAALSPDGKILAMLPMSWLRGPAAVVRFYSVPSGAEIPGLKPPNGAEHWIAFSPDGKTVLLGNSHRLREWDPAAGKLVREMTGPAEHPVVYSADRSKLATHSRGAMLFWDLATSQHVRPDLAEGGHTDGVLGVTVSPDGGRIATNGFEGDVRIWSDTGRPLCRVRSTWGNDQRVAFLPNSRSFIAIATDYVTPIIYESDTGRELRRFAVAPESAKLETTDSVRISADGKSLITTSSPVTVGKNGFTIRWDIASGRPVDRMEQKDVRPFDMEIQMAAFSPDRRWLFKNGRMRRLETDRWFEMIPFNEAIFSFPRFSENSRLVAVRRTPRNGNIPDWNRSSVVVADVFGPGGIAELPTKRVHGYAFSPDGRRIAIVGADAVTLWDLESATLVKTIATAPRTGSTKAIAFTPDGSKLVTGHDDCTAMVWDIHETRRAIAPALPAVAIAELWDRLAGTDAAAAYFAELDLAERPQQASALLRDKLKPVRAADEAVVQKLVTQLGSASFAEREAAEGELRRLKDSALPGLRSARKAGLAAEPKARVERLLAASAVRVLAPGNELREIRAIAILERMATVEAHAVLAELGGGLAEARLTREAIEALSRLKPAP